MAKTLQRESGFAKLQSRSHQIYFTHDFAQRNGDQELSVSQFSKTFRYRLIYVKAALANKLKESKVRDRYLATQKDSEEEILECI
jgi:hypothetical protein